ncbi:MAG: DUF2917 domain-containing protein [Thermodesulfovibrionales bacterium]|jgi:hypothetical protein|nr:DUF2917 domain-containing protein [Thermodesulfovibrionales bacterium]
MRLNPCNIKAGSNFSGTIAHAGDNPIKICMYEDSMVRLERDARGIIIGCTEGILWITQQDDFTDYLLHSGERLTINRKGLVIITALTDTKALISLSEF